MSALDTWDRISGLFAGIEQRLSEELRKTFDLGVSEFRALQRLSIRDDRELRMSELSEILQLSQSSMTRLVERLERRGYVYRDNCPSDGRGKFCVLTESGEAYILAAIPEFEQTLERVLSETFAAKDARMIARDFADIAPTQP